MFAIEAADKSDKQLSEAALEHKAKLIESYNIYTFNNVFKRDFFNIIVKDWVDNYQEITGDSSSKSDEEKVLDLIKLRYPNTKINVGDIRKLINEPNKVKERFQNARIIRVTLEALIGLYELATAETDQTTEEANDCDSDHYIEDIATLFKLGKLCQEGFLVNDDIKALNGKEDRELTSLKTKIDNDLKQLEEDKNIVGRTVVLTDEQAGTLSYLEEALKQIGNYGRMDNYTTFIGSRHFETLEDHNNLELSNSRFFGNMEKYFYNPVPLTIKNIKQFPYIQTVYCYNKEEFKDFIKILISDDKEIQDLVKNIIAVHFFVPTRIPGLKYAEVKCIHEYFLRRLIGYNDIGYNEELDTVCNQLSKYIEMIDSNRYAIYNLPVENKTLVITPFIYLDTTQELPDIQNIITYNDIGVSREYNDIKNYEGPDCSFYKMNNLTNIISRLDKQTTVHSRKKLVITKCPKLEYLEILADKKVPLSFDITGCPNLKTIRMPSWCKHKELEEYLRLNNENIKFEYYQFDNDLKNYDNIDGIETDILGFGVFLIIPDSIKKIKFIDSNIYFRYILLPKHFENTEFHDKLKSLIQDNTKIIFYTNDPDDGCESYLEEDC